MTDRESPDVLTRGAWQTDGKGVLRWVDNAPDPRPAQSASALATLIACPKCHAKIGQACRTPCGTCTAPHAARIVQRYCDCGAKLKARRRLCDYCRRVSRLETFKLYDARRWPREDRRAS